MTLPSPRASTDDAGSLCRAAVVLLLMWTEVEADLATLTRHVVHDEVSAEVTIKGLANSDGSVVRIEAEHPAYNSRVSMIPVIITIIMVMTTLSECVVILTNQIGLPWKRIAPSLLLVPPTSCISVLLKFGDGDSVK